MLRRLPICLAQLQAGNNSERPSNYCIFSTDKKNIQNSSIKIWFTLFLWTMKTVKQVNHTDLNWNKQINLISKILKKNMDLANLNIYQTWKSIKSEYNNNKFKISMPNWNDKFDLPDRSYSIADIQDYFEFIIKKHETLTENPPNLLK